MAFIFQIRGFANLLSVPNSSVFRFLFLASQASDQGSIPIARSITHDDSIVLTPLSPLISAIKPGFLVSRWSQGNKLVPTSQPEVETYRDRKSTRLNSSHGYIS